MPITLTHPPSGRNATVGSSQNSAMVSRPIVIIQRPMRITARPRCCGVATPMATSRMPSAPSADAGAQHRVERAAQVGEIGRRDVQREARGRRAAGRRDRASRRGRDRARRRRARPRRPGRRSPGSAATNACWNASDSTALRAMSFARLMSMGLLAAEWGTIASAICHANSSRTGSLFAIDGRLGEDGRAVAHGGRDRPQPAGERGAEQSGHEEEDRGRPSRDHPRVSARGERGVKRSREQKNALGAAGEPGREARGLLPRAPHIMPRPRDAMRVRPGPVCRGDDRSHAAARGRVAPAGRGGRFCSLRR